MLAVLGVLGGCIAQHGVAGANVRRAVGGGWTTLVVPSTPGSVSYVVAHALAAAWPVHAGQPLVVAERAGGAGALALQAVARGPSDGSMLLLGNTGTHVVRPEVAQGARIATVVPLAKLASAPGVLVGAADLPAATLVDLVQWAKARPGQLSFASAGIGSLGHLVMESLCMRAGITLLHVPYKSSAESRTDLLAGRVHLNILSVNAALPLVRRGRLKAFAFGGALRSAHLPGTPTFLELGFEGADIESWQGLFMHSGVPPATQLRLQAVVADILQDARFRAALELERLDIAATASPAAFAQLIEAQHRQVRALMTSQSLRLI